ncbi:MAG: MerR family DNA-binding protein [Deltaproteobacteria bacterium]|nr:MerR family DNA-binding protein [Deltaproteobacteria bacterium]
MSTLTIGQVAKQAGVGVETVRFYERNGLVPPPPRRASGYRCYPPDTVQRIRFILHAKALGFTLREIGDMLKLRVTRGTACADLREAALSKAHDIDRRIQALQRMRATLMELAAACAANLPTSDCPILTALDRDNDSSKALPGPPGA